MGIFKNMIVSYLLLTLIELGCTQECPCPYCGNNEANCANAGYKRVPGIFPPATIVINMQINRIERIKASDFGELNEIVLLRLDDNALTEIAPRTFASMEKLDELVLSRNKLETLPHDLFHPNAPLSKGIKLKNNLLTTFPLQLLKNNQKFINVDNNPIVCDCFSVIPPELKSKAIGKCHMPLHLRGREIKSIIAAEVGCSICDSIECNNGSCFSEDGSSYTCQCYEGYTGSDCKTLVSEVISTTPSPTITTTPKTSTTTPTTPTMTIPTTTTTTPITTTPTTTAAKLSTTTKTPPTTTTTTTTTTQTTKALPLKTIGTPPTTIISTKITIITKSTSTPATKFSRSPTSTTVTEETTTDTTATETVVTTTETNENSVITTNIPFLNKTKSSNQSSSTVSNTKLKFQRISCNNTESCHLLAERLISNDFKIIIKTPEDVDYIAESIKKIIFYTNASTEDRNKIYPVILQLVNLLLDAKGGLIAKAQLKYDSSLKVLESLHKMAYKVGCQLIKNNDQQYIIGEKNIAFSVAQPINTSMMYVLAGKLNYKSYTVVSSHLDLNDATLQSAMQISSSIMKRKAKNYITSINYQNNLLFLKDDELMTLALGEEGMAQYNISEDGLVIRSNIFSVSIGNYSMRGLTDPVKLMFRNLSVATGENTCRFWDFNLASDENHGAWSTQGCKNADTTDDKFVHCECDHLTNFALVLNTDQEFYNPLALQVISYIGCGLSIAALFITLLVYILFSKINKKLAPKLLICLSTSLIILLVTFIIGAEQTRTQPICQLIAIVIHYFTLSTFCWMACEAFNLYRNFINVFKRTRNENVILVRMSCFAWGLPLAIVSVGVGVALEDYGNENICVVAGNTFFYGMLLPIALILIGNWVVLVLALRGMRGAKILRQNRNHKRQNQYYWMRFLRAAVCATILGITWTFAILAVGDLKIVFQWLFCIFNSLQGLLIFLLFVVNNKEAKSEVVKWIRGRRPIRDTSFEGLSIGNAIINTNLNLPPSI